MPHDVSVTVSDDDKAFADEHDLDLDDLLAEAIEDERQAYEYAHPDPVVPDSVTTLIEQVHKHVTSDSVNVGCMSGQDSVISGRVSLYVGRADEGMRLQLSVSNFEELPDSEVGETLATSGPFLKELRTDLCKTLATLTGMDPDEFTFDLTEHDEPDPDYRFSREKAKYELLVPVGPPPQ